MVWEIRELIMKTVVVSAMPLCGKTYAAKNCNDFSILDLDSSGFSKLSDGSLNPNFKEDYEQAIKENIGKYDIIFVSSHSSTIEILEDNNIAWVKVVPDNLHKETWIGRCWLRDNNSPLLPLLDQHWDEWTNHQNDISYYNQVARITLGADSYIFDKLYWIMTCTYNTII